MAENSTATKGLNRPMEKQPLYTVIRYTSSTEMSTNFNSTSISITADLVCPTVPDYEESVQTITIKSDKFEKCNLQFIGKPILEALPVHTTFYLCDHAGAYKKKAKNSTNNDQGSSSNELEAFYLGRSCSLHVDRLVYLLSQVVALDYWQGTIKAAHDFGGFRLTANEEKKRRAVYCIDYDFACSMVEQLEENVYQCRSFTEDILFYEMDTKEGFLKN
ncbi:hypothetical protein BCV71DRAFT_283053 [Rhizopus microsporus]|uniref:Uncharacterized protein n=1 Tax=Rhizopus microsporus TaxID=58291 RepID=A0A1X0S5P4_RHIZD|nr:hypothetical protein BCV71DRAFT_283053 [Rhizopus microsporus]